MFCSNCGNQINAGLNYCSRCGKQISKAGSESQKSITKSFSEALIYISVFGFIGFVFVILFLVKNVVPENALIFISSFYLATLFGICFFVMRHIKSLSEKSTAEKNDAQEYLPPNQISAKDTVQLEEHFEPAISVTEHTTRNFEKVPLREK
jgi:uncharacterized membrane protein YvbJ